MVNDATDGRRPFTFDRAAFVWNNPHLSCGMIRKGDLFLTAAFAATMLALCGGAIGILTPLGQQITALVALVLWVFFAIKAARY
jgi:hypothetical protein